MLGATACVAIHFARRRGRAIRATLPSSISTGTCLSSLSNIFNSQCSLLSTKNYDDNNANMAAVTMPLLRGRPHPFRPHRREARGDDRIRRFASESSERDRTVVDERGDAAPGDTISGSSQHDTWVQFQRSIAVSGVDTGQVVKERRLGKKKRGGKMDRKRKEREAELEAKLKGLDTTQLKGGEFPALVYSEEETERLLNEAYAAIPPRAGKRGTLNLRRQKRRWFIKRQYDYKKKRERIAAHETRMAKRKETKAAIFLELQKAPATREREREYQEMVLQRWALMNDHVKEEVASKQKLIE